ncbi:response regulator [Desulfococcaceae bacterium HSG9]|nr:response regulator [Desulfococcaceae bacterium HSG9]
MNNTMQSDQRINILLVDDRPENLQALEGVLESPELNLVKVLSGEDALRQLLKHDFALILLDVRMPGLDGFQTAELIQGREKTRNVPIIFVTAEYKSIEHVIQGYALHAIDYIVKPFNRQILKAKVSVLVELYKNRKQVEQQAEQLHKSIQHIEKANLRLQEAESARSRFLSSMSHELRTPLNGILGFTDLLSEQFFGPLNEKQLTYVNQIDSSGKHLLDLINDLLDMAKIDAGAVELEPSKFNIAEAIQTTTTMMKMLFKKKNITLATMIEPELPDITADLRKCKQVIINLLSNAVKFTPEDGRIEIRVTMPWNGFLKIEVSDTGIGIEKDQTEKIFSEFHQADRVRDEQLGGTGLGLALAKRLVELHLGEINVESEVGKGSVFWFSLPLNTPQPEEGAQEQAQKASEPKEETVPSTGHGFRILVAEDNDTNLKMVLDMLSVQEHEVIVARNGQEAVDLAKQHKFDLILMDMRMPVMDGLEATRRLREMPELEDIPIIALTASAGTEAAEEQIAAGCTEHLAKPIRTKELFEALARYLK